MTVVIRFTTSQAPYFKGETAGFPAERAQAYLEAGVAVLVDPRPAREGAFETADVSRAPERAVRHGSRRRS